MYASFKGKFIVAELMSYGWDTIASTEDEQGQNVPLVFDTMEHAEEDIHDHISSIKNAIHEGDMSEDADCERDDFKILMADMDEKGNVTVYEIDNPQHVHTRYNVIHQY